MDTYAEHTFDETIFIDDNGVETKIKPRARVKLHGSVKGNKPIFETESGFFGVYAGHKHAYIVIITQKILLSQTPPYSHPNSFEFAAVQTGTTKDGQNPLYKLVSLSSTQNQNIIHKEDPSKIMPDTTPYKQPA